MKLNPSVKKELGHISLGVLIGDAVMIAVFVALRRFDYRVLLGAALGSATAVGNFFVMCLAIQRAMNEPERAKAIVQGSYGKRMLAMVAVMVLGIVLKTVFNPVAVLVPFLFPGLTIRAMGLLGLVDKEGKAGAQETHES